ncbi:MAG: ABC transporter ATP-binding protein, partial [Clostridia bacterium]|nr:ABC transporter ATP-binding protein [Clostridia bacterium]
MKKNLNKKHTINKVFSYVSKYKPLIFLSVLFAAVSVALTLYIPILIGNSIDLIIDKNNVDFDSILKILINVGVMVGITSALQWLMNTINNFVTFRVVRDIRNEAFRKLQELPLSYIDSHQHGELVSRIIADADQFADGLLMGFTQFFTGIVTIFGTLAFMLSINVKITLLVVILTPISLFVAKFIAKSTYDYFKLQSEIRGEQTAFVDEMIGNQKVVQAFSYENESLSRFDEINEKLTKASIKAVFFSSLTNPVTRFINSLIYAAVGLTGAISVIKGVITIGGLTCFLSYANQYTKPFNEISGVITELQNALACAARVFELIEEPPQTPDEA